VPFSGTWLSPYRACGVARWTRKKEAA